MHDTDRRYLLLVGAIVLAGAILLFLLCRPTDPNAELARAAREAVQLARDADSSATSAVLWGSRFRLLAIVLGATVPMVVAYLIWRSSAGADPDAADILGLMEQYGVPNLDTLPPPESTPAQLRRVPAPETAEQAHA